MPDIHAILAASSLFSGLHPRHIDAVVQSSSVRRLKKGGILFHEGAAGTAVYVLLSGTVQVHKTDQDGSERVIRLFRPGEMFAQVILFERPEYPVTATALERSEVLGISRKRLLALLEDSAFRQDFIAGLMRRQRYLAGRIATLSTPDIEQRFRDFLLEHFGRFERVECRVKRKDVAAAIAVTPETMSRLLARLAQSKRLTWQGRIITVHASFWDGGSVGCPKSKESSAERRMP